MSYEEAWPVIASGEYKRKGNQRENSVEPPRGS